MKQKLKMTAAAAAVAASAAIAAPTAATAGNFAENWVQSAANQPGPVSGALAIVFYPVKVVVHGVVGTVVAGGPADDVMTPIGG